MVVAVDEAVGGKEEGEYDSGVEEVVELRGAGDDKAFDLVDLLSERYGCCHGHDGECTEMEM